MSKRGLLTGLVIVAVVGLAIGIGFSVYTQDTNVPQIPGVTADDTHPDGCVDCHSQGSSGDHRLSTLMADWAANGVPQDIIDTVSPAFPTDSPPSNTHPDVSAMTASSDIPGSCETCHKADGSGSAPALNTLLHLLHYSGDPASNHFITSYGGYCTNCHKLGADGATLVKSGKEQQ